MKVGIITNTNQKGQIVIPSSMRSDLGITEHIPLQITLHGNAIHIVPIAQIVTILESESTYTQLLKKTQGSWGQDNAIEESSRHALESQASIDRKHAW